MGESVVMRRVKQEEERKEERTNLMRDIRTSITDIAVHLSHDANVLVAVEQRVLVVLDTVTPGMHGFVGLEASIGQDDDETLAVLVITGNRNMLFSDQLREAWWWQRLSLRSWTAHRARSVSHVVAFEVCTHSHPHRGLLKATMRCEAMKVW